MKHELIKTFCSDSEFYTKIINVNNPKSYNDYKKVICDFIPVIVQICEYGSNIVKVYEHPLLGYNILPTFKTDFLPLDFYNFEQVDKPLKKSRQYIFEEYMFYSPLDILCLFKTRELMFYIDTLMESGRVLRAKDKSGLIKTDIYFKNENGVVCEACIKIKDIKGFTPAGVSGLEATAKSWGVEFTGKDYKKYFDISDVRKAYKNTDAFACDIEDKSTYSQHDYLIRYSKEDVPVLQKTDDSVNDKAVKIASKLGFSSKFKSFSTIGNMTNQIGVKSLLKQLELNDDDEGRYLLASYLYPSSAISLCDEGWSTAKYLASVDGGYCKHKRTTDVLIYDLISDMDLKSGYASAMEVMPYGIGIPAIISLPESRKKPLWKNLGNRIINNLIDNLWFMRFNTIKPLTFDQDLIFSKIFGEYEFSEIYEDLISDYDDDASSEENNGLKVPTGQFQLLRREIKNGILTSDIKEVIDNYWKPSERNEFYENIEVVSLIFYPKDCEELSLEKFKDNFKIDGEIDFKFSKKSINYNDSRGVCWYRCSMGEGWITPLKKERDELKSAKKQAKGDEYLSIDATQNALKNVNNSTYGVCGSKRYQTDKPKINLKKNGEMSYHASPKIGNIVAAQNITAKVRVSAWCMSKSLNCHQLITDGGAYNPNKVWYWDWFNKESRHYFGSQELYNLCQAKNGSEVDNRRLGTELKPLGGKEWRLINWEYDKDNVGSKYIKTTITNGEIEINGGCENWSILDDMAHQKCKLDFEKLSCIHQIKFESKQLYKGALFQSQANYLFEYFDGEFLIKSRGYNLKGKCYTTPHLSEESEISPHPYKTLMIDVYKGKKTNPEVLTHYQQQLLSSNEKNKTDEIRKNYNERGMLAGCPIVKSTTPELISLSAFNWKTRKQFEEWDKLCEKIKRKTGYKAASKFVITNGKYIKSSELIINGEYDYLESCIQIQKAIDNEIPPKVFYNKFIIEFVDGNNVVYHSQKKIENNFDESVK